MNNRYVYDENEKMFIGKHQCDLCSHKSDEEYGCTIFTKAPQNVLDNKVKCEKFSPKGVTYPWGK